MSICCVGQTDTFFSLARFLYDLGLRRFPPLETIVELCRSPKTRVAAFQYFYNNLGSHYADYKPDDFRDIEFIPVTNGPEEEIHWKKLDNVLQNYSSSNPANTLL